MLCSLVSRDDTSMKGTRKSCLFCQKRYAKNQGVGLDLGVQGQFEIRFFTLILRLPLFLKEGLNGI